MYKGKRERDNKLQEREGKDTYTNRNIMESSVCYVCHDRRRLADTNASEAKLTNQPDSQTLKEVLVRALAVGGSVSEVLEPPENALEQPRGREFETSVCVLSLSARGDGMLESMCERVISDCVILCKRCVSLLKDFDYHERLSVLIAEQLRRFLSKHVSASDTNGTHKRDFDQTNGSDIIGNNIGLIELGSRNVNKPIAKRLDERQGILAAFRALRKSGLSGGKKRGRKRKIEIVSEREMDDVVEIGENVMKMETEKDDRDKYAENAFEKKIARDGENEIKMKIDRENEEENALKKVDSDNERENEIHKKINKDSERESKAKKKIHKNYPDNDSEMNKIIYKYDAEMRQQNETSNTVGSRSSKRIQRRREDGLVMRWGDAIMENGQLSEPGESLMEEAEDSFTLVASNASVNVVDSFNSFASEVDVFIDDYRSKRKRGRKKIHKLTSVMKQRLNCNSESSKLNCESRSSKQDSLSASKCQCPFCKKYYLPSNSRIHNCTSYKNQLRCHMCKIFFTSYVRLEKHLEVIHLKPKQMYCPRENCAFVCISEPALIMHKHFHFLGVCEGRDSTSQTGKSRRVCEGVRSSSVCEIVESTSTCELAESTNTCDFVGSSSDIDTQSAPTPIVNPCVVGEVTVMADIQGVVTSPDLAEQVSFLLDEKSFLSNGQPINITTTDKRKTQLDDTEIQVVYPLKHNDSNSKQDRIISKETRLKDDVNVHKETHLISKNNETLHKDHVNVNKGAHLISNESHGELYILSSGLGKKYKCPVCNISLRTFKLIQEHVMMIHKLQVRCESEKKSHTSVRMAKGSASDPIIIEKECDTGVVLEKNSNLTSQKDRFRTDKLVKERVQRNCMDINKMLCDDID